MNIGRINDSKSLSSCIETSAKPNLLIMPVIDYQQVLRHLIFIKEEIDYSAFISLK